MLTVAVCSHDDDSEDELQSSQGKIERCVLRHFHEHVHNAQQLWLNSGGTIFEEWRKTVQLDVFLVFGLSKKLTARSY